MAATFEMVLKDGARATLTVSVELDDSAQHREQRQYELENLMGGYLAGAAPTFISCTLTGFVASKLPRSEVKP